MAAFSGATSSAVAAPLSDRRGASRWEQAKAERRRQFNRRQRQLRQGLVDFISTGSALNLLTLPVIYSLAIPLLLLDAWVSLFQVLCFPLFGIARVPRAPFFAFDRHRLAYLNAIEKAHCAYCSYATGLLSYVSEVAARTEQYWCPIKHERPIAAPHDRYQLFFEFGDAEGYHGQLSSIRRALRGPRQEKRS